jgi:hypothetical protein
MYLSCFKSSYIFSFLISFRPLLDDNCVSMPTVSIGKFLAAPLFPGVLWDEAEKSFSADTDAFG